MVSALILMSAAPSGLSPAAPLPALEPHDVLVTVGEVGPDRAGIWVRGDEGGPVHLRYAADGGADATELDIPVDAARDFTGRVVLTGLEPGRRYLYEASQAGSEARGTFVSAPGPGDDAPVRLTWSADLGASGYCRDVEDGYAIFRTMAARHPDLFFFAGDTIYADQTCGTRPHVPGADYVAHTLPEFHGKHRYNRADPVLQEFFRTTPVFAMWDDHEVTNNFSGPTEPLMAVGRQAMLDYWPIEAPPEEPGRLFRRVRWGRNLDVFLLDVRQYRSDNNDADGPAKTMLGLAQRDWLLRELAVSSATWKLVLTSVPLGMFTGGSHSDSWSNVNLFGFPRSSHTGFVHERDLILKSIRDHEVRNVVFLSGDVHHGALIRHEPVPGFVLHELVAGPLAARQGYPLFLDRSLGSRSLGSLGFSPNFGELVVDASGLQANIIDGGGHVRTSLRLRADGLVDTARR